MTEEEPSKSTPAQDVGKLQVEAYSLEDVKQALDMYVDMYEESCVHIDSHQPISEVPEAHAIDMIHNKMLEKIILDALEHYVGKLEEAQKSKK